MKKIFGALFSALLFMFLLSAMAVPAFASTPTAEAPEWSVGDRWAFGADTDVGAEFDEILTNLTNMLEMADEVDEVNEMSRDRRRVRHGNGHGGLGHPGRGGVHNR